MWDRTGGKLSGRLRSVRTHTYAFHFLLDSSDLQQPSSWALLSGGRLPYFVYKSPDENYLPCFALLRCPNDGPLLLQVKEACVLSLALQLLEGAKLEVGRGLFPQNLLVSAFS